MESEKSNVLLIGGTRETYFGFRAEASWKLGFQTLEMNESSVK